MATPETEEEWLAAAQGKRAREVEEMVSGHERGDRPGTKKSPKLAREKLIYDVSEGEVRRQVECPPGHGRQQEAGTPKPFTGAT